MGTHTHTHTYIHTHIQSIWIEVFWLYIFLEIRFEIWQPFELTCLKVQTIYKSALFKNNKVSGMSPFRKLCKLVFLCVVSQHVFGCACWRLSHRCVCVCVCVCVLATHSNWLEVLLNSRVSNHISRGQLTAEVKGQLQPQW